MIIDPFTIFITLAALILVIRFKVNSVWLVLGGGVLGAIYKLFLGLLLSRQKENPVILDNVITI